jgi:alginate O-acetyltransferase complex protein AlgI
VLVQVTWVFFRARTFSKAAVVLRGMFGLNAAATPILPGIELLMVGVIIGGLVGAHWLMRTRTLESVLARTPAPLLTGAWVLLAFAIVIEQGEGNAFIYFQF